MVALLSTACAGLSRSVSLPNRHSAVHRPQHSIARILLVALIQSTIHRRLFRKATCELHNRFNGVTSPFPASIKVLVLDNRGSVQIRAYLIALAKEFKHIECSS
jgi:hypothetical protein